MPDIVTVELEGRPTWSRQRNISHYGGSLDKENSKTEGKIPFAWILYRELRGGRGSAYTTVYEGTKSGLAHSEMLAIARNEAARWRAANKLYFNSLPATSDEKLDNWVKVLGIKKRNGETRHELRQRCAAKFRASIGPTKRWLTDVCRELLGTDVFVRVWTIEGTDIASAPTPTHWPGVNPGPPAYDLGGGTWFSSRCHFIVETQRPEYMSEADYLLLVSVYLFEVLDRMLPVWATFDWAESLSGGGFTLGVDKLDFGALG